MSSVTLAEKDCVPCRGGVPRLAGNDLQRIRGDLGGDWELVEDHHLTKSFKFKNFQRALDFTNRVGALAEEVSHHPDIHLSWGQVRVEVWTHNVDGLTETDFVFAAKVDRLPGS